MRLLTQSLPNTEHTEYSTQLNIGCSELQKKNYIDLRAVKLKISWEEWDYCFYFSFIEVLDFVKYV